MSPDDLGLAVAHRAPTCTGCCCSAAKAEPGRAAGGQLGTLDAIAALVPETSALNRLLAPLHVVAGLLAATGPVFRCTFGEAGTSSRWCPSCWGRRCEQHLSPQRTCRRAHHRW